MKTLSHNMILLESLLFMRAAGGPIGQRKRLFMDINKNTLSEWCTKQDQHLINARLLSISNGWFFLLLSHTHKCTHMHECIHV